MFRVVSRVSGADGEWNYGTHKINAKSSYGEIIDELTSPQPASVKITFPEGKQVVQMANILAEKGICKKQEFMDLCSVSNISVFILDSYLHGYYIHGLSPFLKADVNYDELFGYLNQEGTGVARSRGLENDNIEEHNKNQSYEMFLSHVMRTIYDGLYIIQTESMMVKGVNAQNYFKKSRLGRRLFRNFINFMHIY